MSRLEKEKIENYEDAVVIGMLVMKWMQVCALRIGKSESDWNPY